MTRSKGRRRSLQPTEVIWKIPKQAVFEFVADNSFAYAAAMAFYTMLSLAPLLILVLSITSVFAETESIRSEIIAQVRSTVGPEGARVVSTVIGNAEHSREGRSATVIGIVVLLLAATAVFAQLQAALNQIWGVQTRPEAYVVSFLITRLLSFGIVLGIGSLLLISLLVSSAISLVSNRLPLTSLSLYHLWSMLDLAISIAMTTVLFALLFRFVPDVLISWRDVSIGAFVTAVLFTVGKLFIARYLGASTLRSVYGAAGSLVVLLFWVYYSTLILLFGAELSQVYTRRTGSSLVPRRFGVLVKDTDEA